MKPGDWVQLLPLSNISHSSYGIPPGSVGRVIKCNSDTFLQHWKIYWFFQETEWNVYTRFLEEFTWDLGKIADLNPVQKEEVLKSLPKIQKEFIGARWR